MWSLRQARVAIVIAGCLGMAFSELITCSASIQFVRHLGGTGLHVGILGALPTGMLFAQFLAAWLGNRLSYRRHWWFWCSIVQRLFCVPAALGPWLFPQVPDIYWLWAVLGSWGITQGLIHFCTPLWLSWMGDYLPRQGLSHYWGVRQRWMQATAALALIGAGLYLRFGAGGIRDGFPVIVLVGCLLGVVDILMFFKVDEPAVTRMENASFREVLSGPFRHPGFRSFIGFTCFWHLATMVGAPFISLFLLDHVGLSTDQVLLLWVFSWVGGALTSQWLGRLTEVHGNRPVLVLCVAFKSINMVALLLTPQNPQLAFWFLGPIFMIDNTLNTGMAIANNGFLLKNSPAANRTMYIAAGTAVAGLVGGVTSVICGLWLTSMTGWQMSFAGRAVTGYHILFLASTVLRLGAIVLVRHVREPHGDSARNVMQLLIGVDPTRVLRFPAGLYRRWAGQESKPPTPVPTTIPVLREDEAAAARRQSA